METDEPLPAMKAPSGLPGEILEAAVELFSERGYHGTSVRDILESTAASKGGFYHHFESKEQILVSIHDTFIDYELATAERIVDEYSDPEERLHQLIRAHMQSIFEHQKQMNVFLQEVQELSDQKFESVQLKRRRYQGIFESTIAVCVSQGRLRADIDPKLQALLLVGALNAVVRWYRPGEWSVDEITEAVSGLAFHGLAGGIEGGRVG